MLYSRSAASAAWPSGDFTHALSATGAAVYTRNQPWAAPDYTLFVAVTAIPGREQGVLYFGGFSREPAKSTRVVWDLVRVTGVALPR